MGENGGTADGMDRCIDCRACCGWRRLSELEADHRETVAGLEGLIADAGASLFTHCHVKYQ